MALVEIQDLTIAFGGRAAVSDLSLKLEGGDRVGLIGESGSGKSVTARSILQIVDAPGQIVSGEIILHNPNGSTVDLAKLNPRGKEIRKVRGKQIAMIFQEPMSSLSPVHTVGDQIMEVLRLHLDMSKAEARARTIELLTQVEIPNPDFHISTTLAFQADLTWRAAS